MRNLFYQGNFCSECGNRLKAPRFSFRPRHFCEECAARLRQRSYVTPLAIFLLVGSLAVFAFSYKRQDGQIQKLNAPPVISAQDSIVNQPKQKQTQNQQRVFCGARTKKGTPCRHLVQPGQRCAQHRGKPSLLADKP
ncbi:MAG: hypothetical protein AAB401_14600 [Acidobacteriota bacterium]